MYAFAQEAQSVQNPVTGFETRRQLPLRAFGSALAMEPCVVSSLSCHLEAHSSTPAFIRCAHMHTCHEGIRQSIASKRQNRSGSTKDATR
jgi:hypothetical protein